MIIDNISSEDRDKRILGLVKLSNLDKLRRLRVVNVPNWGRFHIIDSNTK